MLCGGRLVGESKFDSVFYKDLAYAIISTIASLSRSDFPLSPPLRHLILEVNRYTNTGNNVNLKGNL
jgi:hypothetical protein